MQFVVFIGDKPSSKNKSDNVAFVGTQSYKRLLQWFFILDIDVNRVKIINRDDIKTAFGGYKHIALGKHAHKHLEDNHIEHFTLPHPSPLNRQVNDVRFMDKIMKEAYEYIHGKG